MRTIYELEESEFWNGTPGQSFLERKRYKEHLTSRAKI
jgi:hypothetical protein